MRKTKFGKFMIEGKVIIKSKVGAIGGKGCWVYVSFEVGL